jgi:hypothetical protein
MPLLGHVSRTVEPKFWEILSMHSRSTGTRTIPVQERNVVRMAIHKYS